MLDSAHTYAVQLREHFVVFDLNLFLKRFYIEQPVSVDNKEHVKFHSAWHDKGMRLFPHIVGNAVN